LGDDVGSTVTVGIEVAMTFDVGGTEVSIGATVGVVAGLPHPTTNSIKNVRTIIGTNFLLSILISILYCDEIQPPND
jgi:hypothetical protein